MLCYKAQIHWTSVLVAQCNNVHVSVPLHFCFKYWDHEIHVEIFIGLQNFHIIYPKTPHRPSWSWMRDDRQYFITNKYLQKLLLFIIKTSQKKKIARAHKTPRRSDNSVVTYDENKTLHSKIVYKSTQQCISSPYMFFPVFPHVFTTRWCIAKFGPSILWWCLPYEIIKTRDG